jgi:DNA repair photolyase
MKNYNIDSKCFPETCIIKSNAVEVLKEELNKKTWHNYPGIIQFGNLQDVYQPIENKLKFTRTILELLYQNQKPCGILTKSTLINNDIDLLSEMAKKNLVQVDMSIACLDEKLQKSIEPHAPVYSARFKILKKMSERGISTGIFIDPALPIFTLDAIDDIFKMGKECGVKYIFLGGIHMRYWKYKIFQEAVNKVYPNINISNYMDFKQQVCLNINHYYEIIKKSFSCSIKYQLPFASTDPQYTTCNFNFGSFHFRHPLIYDYLDFLIKYRGKYVHLEDLILYLGARYEKTFYTSLDWFWNNKKLFDNIQFLNINSDDDRGVKYRLNDDYKLNEYITKIKSPFKL